MSEATLTVPTAFVDISQLAEGLADRVDEGRLMLYGPEPMEEGAWVRFAVLLEDQSPALEGMGRAVTSIDGGEERPEVARFDIVLDNLQLDGTGEVVYERILMVRSAAFGEEPATGEVSLDEVESVEDSVAPTPGATEPQPGDEFVDEATAVAQPEDYKEHVSASAHEQAASAEADSYGAEEYGQPNDYGQPAGYEPGGYEAQSDDATAVGEMPVDVDDLEDAGHEEPAAGEPAFHDPGLAADADQAYGEPAYSQPGESAYEDVGDQAFADEGGYGAGDAAMEVDAGAFGVEGTGEVGMEDVEELTSLPPSAPPPAMPDAPQGFHIEAVGADGRALSRPSVQASWVPQAAPPPDPQPSSGLFAYAGGIPLPSAAPRPDLDPSLRIQPAPRPAPGATGSQPAPDHGQDYDQGYDQQGYDQGYDRDAGDDPTYGASPEMTSPEVTAPDVAAPGQELPETLEADLDDLEDLGLETVDPGEQVTVDPGSEPEDYQSETETGEVVTEVEPTGETAVDVESPDEDRQ